jgi:hypothetical protein
MLLGINADQLIGIVYQNLDSWWVFFSDLGFWQQLYFKSELQPIWFQEAEMDAAEVCMHIQLPRCAWGTTEPQGGVHATVHHPAVWHRVLPVLPLYGIFMSYMLCGGTVLQGGFRHREQIHIYRYTNLWRPTALHHVRHPQGATKRQVGSAEQCILCTPSLGSHEVEWPDLK